MKTKKILQWIVVVAILVSSFASTGSALAWNNCASYITVQWGDTLSGIAAFCGTTVDAIRGANPGLGWWVYAGQVLYIPNGSSYYPASNSSAGGTYTVRWGDTLGKIAASYGMSLNALLAANPKIWNASLIFPGQVINIPAASSVPAYVPPPYVTPPPTSSYFDGLLTVTAINGVNIRNQANYDGSILLVDDKTKGVTFSYRMNSVTYDNAHRRVWVEVALPQSINGYSSGWLPVSGPEDPIKNTGAIQDWVTPHIQ